MMASTVLLTGVGWAVTAVWVEPRFAGKPPEEGGPVPASSAALGSERLTDQERRALVLACAGAALTAGAFAAAAWIPGAPLLFITFLVPGLVYGIATGTLRSDKDAARLMS